jgi:hypothetical protein
VTQRAAFKEADVARAIRGAERAGVKASGVEIAPDGTIRVLLGDAAPAAVGGRSALDQWLAANGKG